jgi:Pentapeptide repeats (9 copies)
MTAPTDSPAMPAWPTCQAADGCRGVRVGADGACLAHLDDSELAGWLATLGPGSDLDLRGTQIGDERLARLLDALHDEHGHPCLGTSRFGEAQFTGNAEFGEAQFTGNAEFGEAQFTRDALFGEARFTGTAGFGGARFTRTAEFSRTQFTGNAGFDRAQFSRIAQFDVAQFGGSALFGWAQFSENALFGAARFAGTARFDRARFTGDALFGVARFTRDAWFGGAQFSGTARFSGAEFTGEARFDAAQFDGDAQFHEARFTKDARFDEARFSETTLFGGTLFRESTLFGGALFTGDARFDGARFTRPVALGPLLVHGTLSFFAATLEDTLVVEAAAARVRLDRATCAAGVSLRLRYAEVVLDGARLAQPATLAAADPFTWSTRSGRAPSDETAIAPGRSPTPRLLSVRTTDVANLVVTDLALAPCRISGAYHLDQLRLEGAIEFAQPPRGLRVGRAWPPVWWWTRRQTLAEEHAWRATRPKGAGWHGPESQPPAWLAEATGQPPQVIGPERLAGLYRALRQAQESSKNEPGAADFYYGEMEMRRLTSKTPWAERVILFAYWLVAGYGLRGLRALAALAVVVVALAGLFSAVGFMPASPAPSWWDSLLYTAGSTLSISDNTLQLTAWGKLLRILLRLLGPLLLGLALLSVRNRVKR